MSLKIAPFYWSTFNVAITMLSTLMNICQVHFFNFSLMANFIPRLIPVAERTRTRWKQVRSSWVTGNATRINKCSIGLKSHYNTLNTFFASFHRYLLTRISYTCVQIVTIRWLSNVTEGTIFCNRMFCFALPMTFMIDEIMTTATHFRSWNKILNLGFTSLTSRILPN